MHVAWIIIPEQFTVIEARSALFEGKGSEPKNEALLVYGWHTLSKRAQNTKNCEGSHSVRLLFINRLLLHAILF